MAAQGAGGKNTIIAASTGAANKRFAHGNLFKASLGVSPAPLPQFLRTKIGKSDIDPAIRPSRRAKAETVPIVDITYDASKHCSLVK